MGRSGIRLKSSDDIKRIAESGKIIADIFTHLGGLSLDGLSTLEVDEIVEKQIHASKSRPSFKTVADYNHATCISVNDEVVHGIPSKRKIIKKGDIVKIDIGVVKNGFFADACRTFCIGAVSENARRLVETTRKALSLAIEVMYPGRRLGDIGAAIQELAEKEGYSVVRDFTGHGVGYAVHEMPNVPHYGKRGTGMVLKEGMVLAVEPMINEGKYHVIVLADGWTAVTADGKLSAQFEHTIAVTENGPIVLTG